MAAAAGIVVTEIRTPISAPELAVVRLSMPATPAPKATKKAKKSGLEIAWANVDSSNEKDSGASPDDFVPAEHELTGFISNPDFFSFFVAFVAGVVGMLSLTSTKSGALIGVLISVTTIPAASNIGVAAAYGDWGEAGGAAAQLAINLITIVLAGVLTLFIQRRYYITRRRKHLSDPMRAAAGLPIGDSARRRRS